MAGKKAEYKSYKQIKEQCVSGQVGKRAAAILLSILGHKLLGQGRVIFWRGWGGVGEIYFFLFTEPHGPPAAASHKWQPVGQSQPQNGGGSSCYYLLSTEAVTLVTYRFQHVTLKIKLGGSWKRCRCSQKALPEPSFFEQ